MTQVIEEYSNPELTIFSLRSSLLATIPLHLHCVKIDAHMSFL